MLKNVAIGKKGNLVIVQITPAGKNRYRAQLSTSDALRLADEIANVIGDSDNDYLGGGAPGSRPVAITRLGTTIILTICGDGKNYRAVNLSAEDARELARQLRVEAL